MARRTGFMFCTSQTPVSGQAVFRSGPTALRDGSRYGEDLRKCCRHLVDRRWPDQGYVPGARGGIDPVWF